MQSSKQHRKNSQNVQFLCWRLSVAEALAIRNSTCVTCGPPMAIIKSKEVLINFRHPAIYRRLVKYLKTCLLHFSSPLI